MRTTSTQFFVIDVYESKENQELRWDESNQHRMYSRQQLFQYIQESYGYDNGSEIIVDFEIISLN